MEHPIEKPRDIFLCERPAATGLALVTDKLIVCPHLLYHLLFLHVLYQILNLVTTASDLCAVGKSKCRVLDLTYPDMDKLSLLLHHRFSRDVSLQTCC